MVLNLGECTGSMRGPMYHRMECYRMVREMHGRHRVAHGGRQKVEPTRRRHLFTDGNVPENGRQQARRK